MKITGQRIGGRMRELKPGMIIFLFPSKQSMSREKKISTKLSTLNRFDRESVVWENVNIGKELVGHQLMHLNLFCEDEENLNWSR